MPVRADAGNAIWLFLHALSFIANNTQMTDKFYTLVASIINLLPCSKCRDHFQAHISKPNYVNIPSNQPMIRLHYVHNVVNKMLFKKLFELDKLIPMYEKYTKNVELILPYLSRIILTYSEYWFRTRWNSNLEMDKINEIKVIMFITFELLQLPIQKLNDWISINEYWKYDNIYNMLKNNNIIYDIPYGFNYSTKGCECHNK